MRYIYLLLDLVTYEAHKTLLIQLKNKNLNVAIADASTSSCFFKKNNKIDWPDEIFCDIDLKSDDVVIYTKPYISHYSKFWQKKHLSKNVYFAYAPAWAYHSNSLFECDFFSIIDYVFATSDYDYEGYSNFCAKPKKIIKIEDPRIFEGNEKIQSSSIESKFDLLWSPHWLTDWYGWPKGYSTWLSTVSLVKIYAETNLSKRICIRPHPMVPLMIESISAKGFYATSPFAQALSDWQKLSKLENVFFSNDTLVNDIILSKRMLTDFSSVALYAAEFKKEIGLCFHADGPPVSVVGDRIKKFSADLSEIDARVRWLFDEGHRRDPVNSLCFNESVTGMYVFKDKTPVDVFLENLS